MKIIEKLETTFKEHTLQWYMKYKVDPTKNQTRMYVEIIVDLIK